MKIGPLGIPELLIILLVIMLIFGAKRLPEIGSSLGKGIRTFKSSVTGEDEEKSSVGTETASKKDEDNRDSGF